MGVIIETHEIKAHLLVQGNSYPMLDVNPHKHNELHFLLRDHVFQFLVVHQEYAQPIIVGKQSFAILPVLTPYQMNVKYIVEDWIQKEEQTLIPTVYIGTEPVDV